MWLQREHKKRAYDQLFELLYRLEARITSLLDVGCGTGGFLEAARGRGVTEVYGFDASEAQVEVARAHTPTVRVATTLRDYVRILGCARPRWDLITLWDVIEHVHEPESLLDEIRTHCGSTTYVFLSTPNALAEHMKFWVRRLLFASHTFVPWEHVVYYSKPGLHMLLRRHGFRVLYSSGCVCYERPLNAFELLRRIGFALTRRTPLTPQLFVLCKPDMT